MPSVTRPRSAAQQRRETVVEQVLVAVEGLLAEGHTYTELPVQRIARQAGIARSTFYVHFPDKTQLLTHLGAQAAEKLFPPAEAWWRGDHKAGAAGVAETITRMIAGFRANQHVLLAVMEVAAYDPGVGELWRARVQAFIELVRGRLAELRDQGRVNATLDPGPTAAALVWMVERAISQHVLTDDGAGDEDLARTLGRAIWLAVYGDGLPRA